MTTKASKKSSDPRVGAALADAMSKAIDAAPPFSASKMLLGDAYKGLRSRSRTWSDKKIVDTLKMVRLHTTISGECADHINTALEILKS